MGRHVIQPYVFMVSNWSTIKERRKQERNEYGQIYNSEIAHFLTKIPITRLCNKILFLGNKVYRINPLLEDCVLL